MQASFWETFKRTEGFQTRRYGFIEDEMLRAGATVYYYPALDGGGGIAVCPEGPVLDWEDSVSARAFLRALLAAVQQDFPDALALRIEPHLPPPRPSLLRNWQRAPLDLTPAQTLLIDLTQSDDALFAAMRPKGRYNFRLSERHGVRVTHSDAARDLPAFYRLFDDTARRQQFYAEPYRFFLNLSTTLFPGRHASLFFAEWQGKILAAALVVFFGRRAAYLYGGSAAEDRQVMPVYALHIAAMREARRRGCVEYDFYGYEPFGRADHPYAGFSAFKQQFGGTPVASIGAHDHLFYDRLADRLLPRLCEEAPPRKEKTV